MSMFNLEAFPDLKISLLMINLNKALAKPLGDSLNENIQCYKAPKSEKETNEQYAQRATRCLKAWNEKFEQLKTNTDKVTQNLTEKKATFNSRLLNCMNIVNESEIEVCQKEEKLAYIENLKQIVIDVTRPKNKK